ncbi:thioesterase superfamily protein [Stackebrandtia albiflava]|uniref:Thioesterase superfamily protein n=1 Tax=Stackebrandtia albiflava TaxID=406432 RepID=A0A562VDM1_9ACTN|nr:thioesterase family protein [Stackebrandtia albiflava]TWJ15917.1 thioesterase superfamily protein [Stackebrandtia albiflava]
MPPTPPAYFTRLDTHRFAPTGHAQGAWASDEQHFSPLGGLITHAVERHARLDDRTGTLLSRISFDILGRPALDACEIHVETVRPGRTIELIEATARIGGRQVVRARAWCLAAHDTAAVAGGGPDRLPHPRDLDTYPLSQAWPGGYIASLDFRPVTPPRPGRTRGWVSTGLDLVAGEKAGPYARYLALVDTANGIAVRRPPTEWMFPNVDLTVHLHRRPEGDWTGLDTTVVFGATGLGVTATVLHDVTGPVGYAQQALTVRALPA